MRTLYLDVLVLHCYEFPKEIVFEFNLLGQDYFIESENIVNEISIIIKQLKGPFENLRQLDRKHK